MATPTKSRSKPSKRSRVTPVPVRFGDDEQPMFRLLQARASACDRSLSGQLKHYARLAMIAEDNPDLPLSMIEGILEAQAELKHGLGEPYQWGVLTDARRPDLLVRPAPTPDAR